VSTDAGFDTLSFAGIEIVEDPYLPEGFIMMRDREGTTILNTKDGTVIKVPHSLLSPIKLVVK